VWAEPSVLERARHEFADMEAMLQTAEQLYGPYRWGRYDVLVLPPAFPFGGMENPRLTFATPTILAGDRSLVALVAHELAHSWSGNLVTNATWSDLWLNEGFTVYIERRIVEALYGRERARMEAALGRRDLQAELDEVDAADEALHVDLRGRDPDDGLNDVPYEKGALFLETLERAYGRPTFDPFLHAWFDEHAFTSVTTEQFVGFLQRELLASEKPRPGSEPPKVDDWVYGSGIPEEAPPAGADAFDPVDEAVHAFAAGKPPGALDTDAWTPHHWLHFLRSLPPDLSAKRLAVLDRAFSLTKSGNYEILAQWLEVAVRRGYHRVDQRLEAFLMEVGRRKFLLPLYRSLVESGRAAEARRIYARARPGYHPISRGSVDALLAG
jgi:aminopeptidase N